MDIYSVKTSDYDQNRVLVKRKKSYITNFRTWTTGYVVPKNKKDEFVQQLKKVNTKSSVLSALVFPFGIAIGFFTGRMFPITKVDAKPVNYAYGALAGWLLGSVGVDLADHNCVNKLLKDFNAEKYSGDKKAC